MKSGGNHRSIKEWMRIFSELYSEADSKRTPEQIWVAVMAHSSSIGESIRRFAFGELLHHAAHTFCWLCSFVNKCNEIKNDIFSCTESLCGIVSLKYPLKCGHCKIDYCQCKARRIDAQRDKSAQYSELFRYREGVLESVETYSIAQWKEKFRDIYGDRVHIQTTDSIGFHFLEEVGEGAVAVRSLSQLRSIVDEGIEGIDENFLNELITVEGIVKNYAKHYIHPKEIDYASKNSEMLKGRIVDAKIRMVIEIADTFSWLCAIMNKLDEILDASEFSLPSLEEKLNEEYINDNGTARCPTCNANPCSCVFFP